MAIVLSNQDNIELLLTLVKVAIALGLIAITMGLLFWLRLKKLEKRIYLSRKHLNKRLASRNYPKMSKKIMAATAAMTLYTPQTGNFLMEANRRDRLFEISDRFV